jgi:polyribonucleotide nucleotidyltransferase
VLRSCRHARRVIATSISDIPFDGPCAATQIGMIDGKLIINPTVIRKRQLYLNLTVASTRDKVIMIEAGAKEIPEQKMIDAIYLADEVNKKVIAFIDRIVAECGKPKHSYESCAVPEELFDAIKERFRRRRWRSPYSPTTSRFATRTSADHRQTGGKIRGQRGVPRGASGRDLPVSEEDRPPMILREHKRPDGRRIRQIRPLGG